MDCCAPGDSPLDHQFDEHHATKHLRAYHAKGARGLTRELIDALAEGGAAGRTVLDIGGGVGAVHHELLRRGAAAALNVDASRAYLKVAREEAERQGHADRASYLLGDFVALADAVEPADLVILDRVICCYPDMAMLVRRSARLARHRYGVVYPRDRWLARLGVAVLNARFRLARSPFRAYVHQAAEVEAILSGQGLVKRFQRRTLLWQLAIYERPVT